SEAVERLREVRRSRPDGALRTISAADPLNLAGIITAGDRIRAAARTRIVYRDGVPLAVKEGDVVRELTAIEPSIAAEVAQALKARIRAYRDSRIAVRDSRFASLVLNPRS